MSDEAGGHGGGVRAIVAALAANLGIAAVKLVAYLLTSSSSMLAEAVPTVADSGNQVLLLLGGRRARREPDEAHPFGYGRERFLYAFIVSIVLFTLGGLFALYEAWHKWLDPHPIEGRWWWVPLAVLAASMVMESLSLRTAVHESAPSRRGRTWWGFVRGTKAPELAVVLLEDTGALLGLTFAAVGVSMTLATHDGRWDALGSAAIGLLLVSIAAILAVETTSLLVGEAAEPADVAAIGAALVGPGIASVIHLRTVHLGPDELLVAAKVEVTARETAEEIATAIDAAEARVRAAVPLARVIYLEPDLRRTP